MCGIVGYTGKEDAADILVGGLKKLEYRGYDSAGVAVVSDGSLHVRKAVGKLSELESVLLKEPVRGSIGLGHTRWATHGEPSVTNAHPHIDFLGKTAVVHNGIIENHAQLRDRLSKAGVKFLSETDTEIIAQLIGFHMDALVKKNGQPARDIFIQAVQKTVAEIEGAYALGIVSSFCPGVMIGVRKECPLILGLSDGATFLASDVPAILAHTREIVYLENGDMAILENDKPSVLKDGTLAAKRQSVHVNWDPQQAEKGEYPHFMLKEIHEQPRTVRETLRGRLQGEDVNLPEISLSKEEARAVTNIQLLACGTSWHAALIGSYWMEDLLGVPCQASIASEFRYRNPALGKNTLVIGLSQSGETADTLAAVRLAREKGSSVIAVANVAGSTLMREAQSNLLTRCGPEIGVAATKTFVGQLTVLRLIALHLARLRGSVPNARLKAMARELNQLPAWIEKALACEPMVKSVVEKFGWRSDFLFLGRNLNYPVALEGALKLKEISYIHAEGYPAGEMKHGPIALIDDQMPVVSIATPAAIHEKMLSNIAEARSRHGKIIVVAAEGDAAAVQSTDDAITVPSVPENLSPFINVVPLQLLAYHAALLRGCDVDKPRNLAKSVTVE